MTTISSTDKNITLESLFSLLAPHWLAGNLLLAMAYFLTGNLGWLSLQVLRRRYGLRQASL